MLLSPKNKITSVIMSRLKGDGSTDMGSPEGPEEDSQAGLKASARKLMSALKSDDESAVVSALQDFMEMNEPKEPDAEPSPPMPPGMAG